MAKRVRYQVVLAKAAPHFHRLPEPVRRVIKLCDGTRTLAEVSQLTDLPRERALAVIERLLAHGVLQPAQDPPRRRRITPVGLAWLAPKPDAIPPAPEPIPAPLPPPPKPVTVTVLPAVVNDALSFSAEEDAFFSRSIDHLLEQ
jgi:hypothetical protein